MQFTIATIALFLSSALAAPYSGGGDYKPCTNALESSPQCCAVDVLGVADLNCKGPSAVPTSPQQFKSICSAEGGAPMCCLLPLLGQGLVCSTPVGV